MMLVMVCRALVRCSLTVTLLFSSVAAADAEDPVGDATTVPVGSADVTTPEIAPSGAPEPVVEAQRPPEQVLTVTVPDVTTVAVMQSKKPVTRHRGAAARALPSTAPRRRKVAPTAPARATARRSPKPHARGGVSARIIAGGRSFPQPAVVVPRSRKPDPAVVFPVAPAASGTAVSAPSEEVPRWLLGVAGFLAIGEAIFLARLASKRWAARRPREPRRGLTR